MDVTETEDQRVHLAVKESKEVVDYPAPSARKVNEVKREIPEMWVNPDTTVTKEKTVHLDCPVSPEKWVLEVSPVREVSLVCPDRRAFPEVKADPVEKATLVLLEQLVLPVKLDLMVLSVLLDLKEFWDHLDRLVPAVKMAFPVFLVLMVHPDIMATLELLVIKDTAVLLDLRAQLVSPAFADPKVTRAPAVSSARKGSKVTKVPMVKKVIWDRKVNEDHRACKEPSVTKDPKVPKVSRDLAVKLVRRDRQARRVSSACRDSPVIPDHLERKETKAHPVDQELLVTRVTEVILEHRENEANRVHGDSEELAGEQGDKE